MSQIRELQKLRGEGSSSSREMRQFVPTEIVARNIDGSEKPSTNPLQVYNFSFFNFCSLIFKEISAAQTFWSGGLDEDTLLQNEQTDKLGMEILIDHEKHRIAKVKNGSGGEKSGKRIHVRFLFIFIAKGLQFDSTCCKEVRI